MSTKSKSPQTTTSETASAESFLSRTLIAPLLFLSFLFSLLWIDRKTSAEIFTHEAPESKSQTRKSSDPSSKYYHSHQRHLARLEVDDAFAYQGKVIALLCVGSAVVLAGGSWAAWRLWHWAQGGDFWDVGKGAGEI
jgi:hypothetical protein